MDLSTLTITVVALASLAWLGFLFSSSISRGATDEVPSNLRPYKTDAELESRRLDTVLATALTLSAFLAIGLPLYYLGEADRQAAAEESFHEEAVSEGRHIYEEEFDCVACHGPAGVGGSAPFVEPRSGIEISWAAPSLNDVFYRYSEEEVRYWIVFGRANTPMPAWGLEGGGPMNSAQVDAVLAYLESIQIPQEEALAQIDQRVRGELNRIETAEDTIRSLIERQEAEREEILRAGEILPEVTQLLEELRRAIREGATGLDSDGDGLSDAAEAEINRITARAQELGLLGGAPAQETDDPEEEEGTEEAEEQEAEEPEEAEEQEAEEPEEAEEPSPVGLGLDPTDPQSTTDVEGEPREDLDAAADALRNLESEATQLQVTVDNQDTLLSQVEGGLAFLERSLEERPWAFDFPALAERMGVSEEQARRAAGLYNAYCARCHTAGYSAGVAFTQEAGSGAFGPALRDGRTVVQFPDRQDHVDFVIQGSENAVGYGVNGIGRGWMPGFGQVLSQEDIELIVDFERGL